MPDPHLKRLIGRQSPVPARFLAGRAQWQAVGAAFIEALAETTDEAIVPVDDDHTALSIRAASAERLRHTGILIPVGPHDTATGFIAFPPSDAVFLASVLLRECPPRTDPAEACSIDAHLLRSVAEELCRSIEQVFGISFGVVGPAVSGLPLAVTDDLLAVRFGARVADRAVEPRLLLIGQPEAFAVVTARPAPCPRLAAVAMSAKAPVSAVLDSWRTSAGIAAAFRPGHVIPLPGASLDGLDLVLDLPNGSVRLASAELGQSRGQQAVRLTSPISFG